MSVCYQHKRTGQIRSRDEWLQEPGGEQAINLMVNSGILKTVPCVLGKDPSDMTDEERTQYNIFSPLLIPVKPITIEKMLLAVFLARLAKDESGRKLLKEIAVKYLDVIGDSLKALARSSAAHWSVAAMNTKVTLRVYKNLGLMTPDEAAGLEVWINAFTSGLAVKDVIGNISSVGSMVFGGKGVPGVAFPPTPK